MDRQAKVKAALLRAVKETPSMEPRALLVCMFDAGYSSREVHRAIQSALGRNELAIDAKMRFIVPRKILQAA